MNVAARFQQVRREFAVDPDPERIAGKLGLAPRTVRRFFEMGNLKAPVSGPSSAALLAYWRSQRDASTAAVVERRYKRLTGDRRWDRDPFADETPREARARVARDLAEGRRCASRLLSGGPCSLLLPCATHGR